MNRITHSKEFAGRIIPVTIIMSIGYSILRYNIMGDVSWDDVPFYILNKGISLAALILLSLNFSIGPLKRLNISVNQQLLDARMSLGIIGFTLAFTHMVMSVAILNPVYLPSFFYEGGLLNARGSLSLLGGVLGIVFLCIYYVNFKPDIKRQYKIIAVVTSREVILSVLFFMGVHLFFVSYPGWLTVHKWHGGLPPISLISFNVLLVCFVINLMGRK
jgi:hypothetical protein